MAGYAARPLAQKLGIKAGMNVCLLGAPEGYLALLQPLPDGVKIAHELGAAADFIQLFTREAAELHQRFPALKAAVAKNGMLWISWPKKAAKVVTDLDENIVREIGLAHGLVDVKVAAVDETWSGLKFVYRLADR